MMEPFLYGVAITFFAWLILSLCIGAVARLVAIVSQMRDEQE